MKYIYLVLLIAFVSVIISCDSSPRVIESQSETGHVHNDANITSGNAAQGTHEVTVNEVLHATKYTYLNVEESGEKFWIAVPRMEAAVGDVYYYQGGLLKKNFESKEFNRIFETLYLVMNVSKKPGLSDLSALEKAHSQLEKGVEDKTQEISGKEVNIEPVRGGVQIKELIENKQKYSGQLVKVKGQCIKVNPNIMGRNWVHLTDGSADDYDFVITTQEVIPVGSVVVLEGKITLDKDFGAGYRYEIIMEEAQVK